MPQRILVIDDYVPAATAVARLLRLRGHTVMIAFDADDVIPLALEFRPDVIFLDIGLAGSEDGVAVASRLRALRSFDDTLIVALTGFDDSGEEARIRGAGFDYHLIKPASLDAMQAIIATGPAPRAGTKAQ
jgi:DNA-binding response OmpR family regulator